MGEGLPPQLPELAEFASRLLVPDGVFATFAGQLYANDLLRVMERTLEFVWIGGLDSTRRLRTFGR